MAFGNNKRSNDIWAGNDAWNQEIGRQGGMQNSMPAGYGPAYTIDAGVTDTVNTYIGKTFLWMFAGLLLTFGLALYMAMSGVAYRLLASEIGSIVLIGAAVLEFACVIALSAAIRKLSPTGAAILFFAYAGLTGIVFSFYFLMFSIGMMVFTFLATAFFFGLMAVLALALKMELGSLKTYLFGGLIALILFSILALFLKIPALDTILCYLGIAVFMGLTAYDTSRIKNNYYYYAQDAAMLKKASIYSAFGLYLDFINLFLYILRLFGNRRK